MSTNATAVRAYACRVEVHRVVEGMERGRL